MAYLLVSCQLMGCQVSTLRFQVSGGAAFGRRGGYGEGVGVGSNLPFGEAACWLGYQIRPCCTQFDNLAVKQVK